MRESEAIAIVQSYLPIVDINLEEFRVCGASPTGEGGWTVHLRSFDGSERHCWAVTVNASGVVAEFASRSSADNAGHGCSSCPSSEDY
jgi:hypothetical protein